MNRINKTGMENISPIQISRAVDKKAVKDTFKMKLNELEQDQIRIELKALYDKIETQSNKLSDKLFIDDLINYKKLVKEFLNITVNNSHVFFKESSLDRRGRHRIYSLVKKVDQELDELTQEFLDIENKRINILKRLNDIQGILMDIMT
ncbi:YaaR family protein [Tissierella sp.]|uniref:YaaR family protein n=1 Tax=Tissierella sp. TaxID=41274 RepID=UPI00285C17E0|nr:YaaR family protein [Tissierella sp.]MDR7857417.1 YaaR family protein [Tissierella sp.]